ncbi:hypothetical protein CFIMG_008006RA00001 [Ceratocystis fimbriata CBS 114723]|uniref:Uncharacterized protein n=1 Tax=Ceratocystis fimbriata CBS 114723 TaxID=1035309 RepID=A0A2C5VYI5_9PEZI|nr:hypothetical protein CFIMG_008006RA00001 [Ceratocystis fimbriata CBS 114723]
MVISVFGPSTTRHAKATRRLLRAPRAKPARLTLDKAMEAVSFAFRAMVTTSAVDLQVLGVPVIRVALTIRMMTVTRIMAERTVAVGAYNV